MIKRLVSLTTNRVCASILVIFLTCVAHATAPVFGQGFLVERDSKVTVAPDSRSSAMIIIEPVKPSPLPRIFRSRLPEPATQYRIESETINATINGSVAKVQVEQTFKNEGKTTLEAFFVFPLPYDGAVDSLTLLINGKEFPAQILDAKVARAQYEEIVRKTKDPALLECLGNGMFKTSVFPIPPGKKQTIQLTYSQLLKSRDGLVEFSFPMNASQFTSAPIEKVKFDLTIVGDTEIKNVYSPTYDLKIDRNGPKVVNVTAALENQTSLNDFRLFFDQNEDELSAKIQSYRPDENDDGYFLLLASPKIVAEESKPLPKTIVFAFDVSGSMSGPKIKQARDSLAFVLSRLAKGDKFNIVLFNGSVSAYREELQTLDEDVRADALAYVAATRASGSTNISGALERAFSLLNQDDSTNPKYLLFLSDGEATTGETNEMKLAEIAKNANKKGARFFSFGVGYDVHSRLLDRFVSDGRGQGEYVKPEENIEECVARLYSRIEAPIFTETSFNFKLEGRELNQYFTNQVYPSGTIDVFAGEQIVVVGRYSTPGDVSITAKGRVKDKEVSFTYPGKFTAKSEDSSYAYVARLWANRRIAEIIDQLDLKGQNKELLDELVALSKKHGIITPYTSFFAAEDFDLNDSAANNVAERQFNSMASQTSNQAGFGQRALKQRLRNQANLSNSAQEMALNDVELADSGMGAMGGSMNSLSSAAFSGNSRRAMGTSRAKAPNAMRSDFAAARTALDSVPMEASVDELFDLPNRDASQNVRHIGDKTFYFKKNVWVDSTITDELRKTLKTIELTPYSDDYFRIVAENGREFSQYLVFPEGVELNYKGALYILKAQSKD